MSIKYLLFSEVAEKLRISKKTLESILRDKEKNFPKSIPLIKKRRWIESDIDDFMKNMEK